MEQESLIARNEDFDLSVSPTEELGIYKESVQPSQEDIEREHQEILNSPERQAEIVFTNYINSLSYNLDGQTKRKVKREILRNAKKGRYKKMFSDEFSGRNADKAKNNFAKLNN